jgi:hypothetical protein
VAHGRNAAGSRLSPSGAHNVVKRAVKALALEPSLSAHDCRHYRATQLLREGVPWRLRSGTRASRPPCRMGMSAVLPLANDQSLHVQNLASAGAGVGAGQRGAHQLRLGAPAAFHTDQ